MATYADWVDITNSATADAKSAAGTIQISPGAHIFNIVVRARPLGAVGNTYAVELNFPGVSQPQKYLICSNGQPIAAGTKSNNQLTGRIPVSVNVPSSVSQVQVFTYADLASAQCTVGLEWEAS